MFWHCVWYTVSVGDYVLIFWDCVCWWLCFDMLALCLLVIMFWYFGTVSVGDYVLMFSTVSDILWLSFDILGLSVGDYVLIFCDCVCWWLCFDILGLCLLMIMFWYFGTVYVGDYVFDILGLCLLVIMFECLALCLIYCVCLWLCFDILALCLLVTMFWFLVLCLLVIMLWCLVVWYRWLCFSVLYCVCR